MANHYLEFSEVINNITPEESAWARQRLQEMTDKFVEGDGEEGWYFEWQIHEDHKNDRDEETEGAHIWVYSEESSEPSHVADFAQEFLKKFRPDECFSLSWASFCDKMRVGEFGGGAVFVTAEKQVWSNSWDFLEEQSKLFKSQAKKVKKKVAP